MERKKENKNCPKMLLRDADFFNEERKCRNETGNVTANPATSKKILLIVPLKPLQLLWTTLFSQI